MYCTSKNCLLYWH